MTGITVCSPPGHYTRATNIGNRETTMRELSTSDLERVSGGGTVSFGQLFIPQILKTTVNPQPAPTPPSPSGSSTGGHKSASFDPVGVRF